MNRIFLIIFSTFILVSCSGGSYDDYLGYWTQPGHNNIYVGSITKVDGNYFYRPNVFYQESDVDKRYKPEGVQNGVDALIKKNGLLTFKGRRTPLTLSEDKNELTVSTYGVSQRISDEIFDQINKIEQARIPESKKCIELRSNAIKANPKAFNGAYNKSQEEREESERELNKLKNAATKLGLISCVFLESQAKLLSNHLN